MVPYQAAIGVQGPLHGLEGWMRHPCHRRQEHTHRVAGVQCHQVVGNLREIVSPRTWQQQVPLGQPGPPLLSVDVFAQASRRQIACRRWSDGWL